MVCSDLSHILIKELTSEPDMNIFRISKIGKKNFFLREASKIFWLLKDVLGSVTKGETNNNLI